MAFRLTWHDAMGALPQLKDTCMRMESGNLRMESGNLIMESGNLIMETCACQNHKKRRRALEGKASPPRGGYLPSGISARPPPWVSVGGP